jgi:NAD(P)-dependent dehydrogenase (short-subunit alcohol dehydrogenase family)
MANQRLAGKVAIVTGSGQGIGREEALLLAREGAAVVINDIGHERETREPTANRTAAEIRSAGGKAVADTANGSTLEGAAHIINAAVNEFGRLDILINNAGLARPEELEHMTEQQWDFVQANNLKNTFFMIKHAIPHFKKQRAGVIVNTGSESGLGHPTMANYSAAKEGVAGLTRAAARELGRFGIRCNAIRPRAGSVGAQRFSGRVSKWQPLMDALGRYWLGERGHIKSLAGPDRIAPLVVWLCTDKAANVNGRTFWVGNDDVGLWSEPEVIRNMTRPGGWDLDSLDEMAPDHLTPDLTNLFLLKDSLGDKEL